MHVCNTIEQLNIVLTEYRNKNIGFVPTMGALHNGHLSLIEKAHAENNCVVCSVFVNPTQFNSIEDLKVYPRNIENDIEILEKSSCSILFAPTVDEIYENGFDVSNMHQGFGSLVKVMEAVFRPGHFNGVIAVVKRLFEIIMPTNAYFGEKDFQQLCIIKKLVSIFNLPVNVVGCSIVRDNDGLAMSSRNMNLNEEERITAALIPKILLEATQKFKQKGASITQTWVEQQFVTTPILTLEYISFANSETLESVDFYIPGLETRAFIVVYAGKTRLIDNMSVL